jgi:L-aminopeptidase/D-esterase-like protein
MKLSNSITDVPGIKVGHYTNETALTGCTVVLCEDGAVGGVDQRGGAPGTRETDLLRPVHLVTDVHGVLIAGGSAFGLDAASGVMQYLEEKAIGFKTGIKPIPIVPGAILFDLGIGDPDVRPDANMGYEACLNAKASPPLEGNYGAGTGCTVGKILGISQAMKSGFGSSSLEIGGGVVVGAVAANNAFGDVMDPATQEIFAGARSKSLGPLRLGKQKYFADTLEVMRSFVGRKIMGFASRSNSIICVVATNAKLDKEGANKVAQMAQDGLARVIKPAHTMLDGDTIFVLATGRRKADVNLVGAFAAEVISQAIVRGTRTAKSAGGLPGLGD